MDKIKIYFPISILLGFILSFSVFAFVVFTVISKAGISIFSVFLIGFLLLILSQARRNLKRYFIEEIIDFPQEILEPGEKLLHKLDNVWIKASARKFILFNFSIYKNHVAITNKRIIFAASFFGKLKFTNNWGNLWFNRKRKTSYGAIKEISFKKEKEPVLIIKGEKINLEYKIYTKSAKEIFEKIAPLLS